MRDGAKTAETVGQIAGGNKLSLAVVLVVTSLPLVIPPLLEGSIHSTMITDSIPDHGILVSFLVLFLLSLTAYINRQLLFKTRPMNGALTAIFTGSCIMSVVYSNEFYRSAVEDYIFRGDVSTYRRVVAVDQLSQVHARHGVNFYGHVNPNKASGIDPMIKVSGAFYNLWSKTKAGGASIPSESSPRCSVRVVVNRSGSAERIVWRSVIDVPDVVECH